MVPFPPLLAFALGALGAALVVKHFAKVGRSDVDLGKQTDPLTESKGEAVPTLRRHPDGIYRP